MTVSSLLSDQSVKNDEDSRALSLLGIIANDSELSGLQRSRDRLCEWEPPPASPLV